MAVIHATSAPNDTELQEDHQSHHEEHGTLDAIFTMATSHDRICQKLEDALYRAVGLRGSEQSDTMMVRRLEMEDLISDLRYATIDLCAIVGEAALRRVAAWHPLHRRISETGLVYELKNGDLDEFLRPIFEESGIGDRFEVRSGHEVYAKDDD